MTALWIALIVLLVIAFWLVLGLASYALFHPFVDSLRGKIIINVVALPVLFALFLPMMRDQKPVMIPAYFGAFALIFALTTVLYHFIERGWCSA